MYIYHSIKEKRSQPLFEPLFLKIASYVKVRSLTIIIVSHYKTNAIINLNFELKRDGQIIVRLAKYLNLHFETVEDYASLDPFYFNRFQS